MLSFQIVTNSLDACLPLQAIEDSWRDPKGNVVASVWYASNCYWFEIPNTAVFACNVDVGTVTATALGETASAIVRDTYNRSILPFLLHAMGFEALHAGAVILNNRVHAFCASSGTGKSTLVDGLRRRANTVWSDDCLALSQSGDQVVTFPAPFHIRLAKTSPRWAKGINQSNSADLIPETYDPDHALTLPIGGIYMLHRGETKGNDLEVRLLSPTTAVQELLTHAYAFSNSTLERRRRTMTYLLNAAASVPVYRLDVPDAYDQLDNVLDFLERVLEEADTWRDDSRQPISSVVLK